MAMEKYGVSNEELKEELTQELIHLREKMVNLVKIGGEFDPGRKSLELQIDAIKARIDACGDATEGQSK